MDHFISAEQLTTKLAVLLQTWPLYREYTYTGMDNVVLLPALISLICPVCKKEQLWKTSSWQGEDNKKGFGSKKYTCKNCEQSSVLYYFYWIKGPNHSAFSKVGQYPAQENHPPIELQKQLDRDDLDFYKKALTCRNFSYGLAALAYLRRVVENRMNDILDLLAQTANDANFAKEKLTELEAAKHSKRFDDKVTYAASILPPHLKPGSQNPIDKLHDIASEGIHKKTEDECIEMFDRSRLVFEYLFRELTLRKEDAKSFIDDLKSLDLKKNAKPG